MGHRERLRRAVFLATVFLAGQFAVDVARAAEPPSFNYKTTLLQVAYPSRMAQDNVGNLYVVDSRSDKVYVFDRYGALVQLVAVGQPRTIAYDSVSDVVYVGTPQGIFVLGEKSAHIVPSEAGDPIDMDVDSQGNLYVVDGVSDSVKVFTCCNDERVSKMSGASFGGGSGWFPVSIEVGAGVESDGVTPGEMIYVGYSVQSLQANNTSHMVRVYGSGGASWVRSYGVPRKTDSSAPLGASELVAASGLTVDPSGRVYVADSYDGRVIVFDEVGVVISGGTLSVPEIPQDVFYDRYGRVVVSDQTGGVQVYVVDGDVDNVAPSLPSLVSPVGGVTVVSTPELRISNATDQNGDSLVYDFVVASDVSMVNVVWEANGVAEGEKVTFVSVDASAGLQEDTVYYWRVRASDGLYYSKYSQTTSFLVNETNNAPLINSGSASPSGGVVSVEESVDAATFNPVRLSVFGQDSDMVGFTAVWMVDGVEVSQGYVANNDEVVYEYQASRGTAGDHTVEVVLEDVRTGAVAASGGSQNWALKVYRYNSAPTIPGLHMPEEGADVKVTTEPSTTIQTQTTSDAEGDALEYSFEISTVSDFTDVLYSVNNDTLSASLATASIASMTLSENTRYYWRVQACESGDAIARGVVESKCSGWSAGRSFVVNDVNDVSTTPGLSYPADGRSVDSLTPALQVMKSSDPDINDVLTYEFEVATDSRFVNVVRSAVGIEGSKVAGTVSWPYVPGGEIVWSDAALSDNTTYYWRSRAVDSGGGTSAWMTSWFFVNTANDAPDMNPNDTPALMTVAAPLAGNEVLVTSPVALEVSDAVDLDGDALTYIFEIDTVNTFSSPAKQTSESQGGTSWAVVAALVDNTTYFWRVKASDSAADSPWTETSSFFVNTENDAPEAPVLKSPIEAAHVPTATPQLSLFDAQDIDGDSVTYTYEVSSDSTFASFDAGSGAGAANVWTVDALLRENGIYYWRAKSTDEHDINSNGWSDTAVFRVNMANDLPTAPVVEWQKVVTNGAVVITVGNSYDADGNGLTYEIEVYSDRELSALAMCDGGGPCRIAGLSEGVDGKTSWPVGSLDNGQPQGFGVYYLRARAHDGIAAGSWSGTRTLTIGGGAPDSRTDKAYGGKRF